MGSDLFCRGIGRSRLKISLCAGSGHDHASHIDAGNIALERYGIANGPVLLCRELDTDAR